MRPDLEALERRFMLVEQVVELPLGRVALEKPRSADDLISEADFVNDDRLPYWADLWPSATVLATYLEHHPVAARARARVRARARHRRRDARRL